MVKQGDIIKINLNPRLGHEQQGYRPYICLSHHLVSDYANIAIFSPISNTPRNYPLYVPLTGTKTTGKVLLDQLVTFDYNARQYNFVETISDHLLTRLLDTVKVVFQKNKKSIN
ncbi:type II toxin-antitoxin system PemK/MazF family toxin [Listeria monocytogenes]|uniref:type II toxin-antitoxin system PemK/MazF family toxin n=1 Tax=Listeria monocytogenes TaxID=1639 RepID=UPI0011EAC5F7|nr:type II toxin-antitoxin system PemK/MazF family toxin [Listeria monocytogenes]EBF5152447.1 type II toxin-antitoxin system PemK/MazF family toxin [Listeria monocytogenes]TYU99877.1 type II toxin-antitoxin system PemK/MazF family toxin [Listeria monocytogenes]